MPIYEYRCENDHLFEVVQRMTDDTLEKCSTCDAPVQRVFHPVAVHFKGSGFYSTDYGKGGAAKTSENGNSEKSSESKSSDSDSGSGSDSSESKSSEPKSSDTKSGDSGSKGSDSGSKSSAASSASTD